GPAAADPYARPRQLGTPGAMPIGLQIGVPTVDQRVFFGDGASAKAYEDALTRLWRLGAAIVEFDMEPLYETARLLYDRPWVAERYLAARSGIEKAPESLHPVTRQILLRGPKPGAAAAFAAVLP